MQNSLHNMGSHDLLINKMSSEESLAFADDLKKKRDKNLSHLTNQGIAYRNYQKVGFSTDFKSPKLADNSMNEPSMIEFGQTKVSSGIHSTEKL